MLKTLFGTLIGLTCSLPTLAGPMGAAHVLPAFYVGAFGGYGVIEGTYHGTMAQGRLTLGLHGWNYKNVTLGTELGVQSGNTMRLQTSEDLLVLAGGLPIEATLKPWLDALITIDYQIVPKRPFFAILKGGIAYRQLQLQGRSSSKDALDKVDGEFLTGLGYDLSHNVRLTALYQGIYSTSNAKITLSSTYDVLIARIPSQHTGLLGVEYSFF